MWETLASSTTFPVFEPASPQARVIRELFFQVLGISVLIFGVMATLIAIAVFRYRARPAADGAADTEPAQDFGSHRREMRWMVGPILVVFWLAAISAKLVLSINARADADPPGGVDADLVVIGHQWWWEVRYPDHGVVAANEIHIPVGRKLRVRIDSADVIHCFWVPRLARKIDAIPGRSNFIWLEADAVGEYQGFCAEFCGTQHAWMRFKVFADTEERFAAWLAQQARPLTPGADAAADRLALQGAQLFRSLPCINCHTASGVTPLPGEAAAGTTGLASVGPDLTHLASRTTIGGGVVANTPENLARWLKDPQAIKPGCKMPNFNLTDDQIAALTAFLGEPQGGRP